MAALHFLGSEIYRGSSYGPRHPLRIPRVPVVVDLIRALGWMTPGEWRSSPRARPAALTAFHTPAYVAALQQAEAEGQVSDATRQRYGLGTLSNPVYPEMFRRPATGAGGTLLAAELIRQGGAAHVPGGGTHHGMPDRASGFCYLNDIALGILSLKRMGIARVAYVDIDAHHGDGVEAAFADDPEVLVLSVHEENRWPFTGLLTDRGAGNVWNLPVPAGFDDTGMAMVLDRLILPRVAGHRPDAIILQAGADGLDEDPLSRLSLSNNAHSAVLRALRPLAPRFLLLGGGGYNPWTVGRLWTRLWADLSGRMVPDRLPPEATRVLAALDWRGGGRPPPAPHLLTTLADRPRRGPVDPEVAARLDRLDQRARAWV